MSVPNPEYAEHIYAHDLKANKNCEYCYEKQESIIKNWFLKKWITYKEYLRLSGLPF